MSWYTDSGFFDIKNKIGDLPHKNLDKPQV